MLPPGTYFAVEFFLPLQTQNPAIIIEDVNNKSNSIIANRFVLSELVKKGIRLKYRRSYLGIVWSLIEPLLTTVVLVIIFGTLFKNNNGSAYTKETYPLFIIIGRLIYSAFNNGTRASSSAIRNNSGMIKKVFVPKYLYPLSAVIYNFIIFLISLIVIIGVDIFCNVQLHLAGKELLLPTWNLLYFIPSLALLFLLTYGVGLFLTVMNVFFRDIEYIWNVLLLIIMYMSAIFYDPTKILESQWFWVLKYNPLYQIIQMCRASFMNQPIDAFSWIYTSAFAAGMVLLSTLFFNRKQNKFILHI